MSTVPNPIDPVTITVVSPDLLRAYSPAVDGSGRLDRLVGIARRHGDRWSAVVRGGERVYFADELQVRMFLLAVLDDPRRGNSGPGGAL